MNPPGYFEEAVLAGNIIDGLGKFDMTGTSGGYREQRWDA